MTPKIVDRVAPRHREKSFEEYRAVARDGASGVADLLDDPFETRRGKEDAIVADILSKLRPDTSKEALAVDIGAGCGPVSERLHRSLVDAGCRVVAIDSPELLARNPEIAGVTRVAGPFPACLDGDATLTARADVVIAYSVLHYVFNHADVFGFVDAALSLLAPGGALFLGDVPSYGMRLRTLDARGGTDEVWRPFRAYPGRIDDGVIFGLMMRAAQAGFHPFLLPQPPQLPMADRRVDLLFRRPV